MRRSRPLRLLAFVSGLVVAVGLFVPVARAGERIQFKNGHTLEIQSSREDGDMVYVKLVNGAEVGFPKSLIQEVERDRVVTRESSEPSNWAGRGKPLNELFGYRALLAATGQAPPIATGVMAGPGAQERYTLGFSFRGSRDVTQNFQKGPSELVSARSMPGPQAPGASTQDGAPVAAPSRRFMQNSNEPSGPE